MQTALLRCFYHRNVGDGSGMSLVDPLLLRLRRELTFMLRRQLDSAGLYECKALRCLPEASISVATRFEIVIYFTPDCSFEAIEEVSKGMAEELRWLLGSTSFGLNCLVAHSTLIDIAGTRETQKTLH